MPPRLGSEEVARRLGAASLVVGVDTGLTGLAAAPAAPVVAPFSRSEPTLCGVAGQGPRVNLGNVDQGPDLSEVLTGSMCSRRRLTDRLAPLAADAMLPEDAI